MLAQLAASQSNENLAGAAWLLIVLTAVLVTTAGFGSFQRATKLKMIAVALVAVVVITGLILAI
jgi:hypothetical protein